MFIASTSLYNSVFLFVCVIIIKMSDERKLNSLKLRFPTYVKKNRGTKVFFMGYAALYKII